MWSSRSILGGLIRSAMDQGQSTPINIQITTKNLTKAGRVAEQILTDVRGVNGVVDARIIQRLNYPEYILEVDQAKSAALGLTQRDVMENLVAAFNSSTAFNKNNFWIDPKSHNQYYVGVQYEEASIVSIETMLDIQITSRAQKKSIPLRNIATLRRTNVPAEIMHTNLQPTIDLTMGVEGRDLGRVASDVQKLVAQYGKVRPDGGWTPYDPNAPGDRIPMEGSKITMSGEYQKMQDTFRYQAYGVIGAVILIYFLMVALFKSYLTPLVILSAVPVGVVGVILMLYFLTGARLSTVRSRSSGVNFMVGIVVSNTVLLTDFAQNLRVAEKLTPTEAIKKAASIRVRPVCMTAMATFFALIPMSLGLEQGSEANVPLGRAVLGGLLAGLVTTLFVVPCIYSPRRSEANWKRNAGAAARRSRLTQARNRPPVGSRSQQQVPSSPIRARSSLTILRPRARTDPQSRPGSRRGSGSRPSSRCGPRALSHRSAPRRSSSSRYRSP